MNVAAALEQLEAPLEVVREVCTNFSDASEKTHRPNLARLFRLLARSCAIQAGHAREREVAARGRRELLKDLADALKKQRSQTYADGMEQAEKVGDRGVLRAFTWGQKVTGIQASLVNKILKSGPDLLGESVGIHVCEACGFLIVKDGAPDVCPVCKAPCERFVSF